MEVLLLLLMLLWKCCCCCCYGSAAAAAAAMFQIFHKSYTTEVRSAITFDTVHWISHFTHDQFSSNFYFIPTAVIPNWTYRILLSQNLHHHLTTPLHQNSAFRFHHLIESQIRKRINSRTTDSEK